MSSITTWRRVEPRVRGTSLTSVEARVYDPLWLLGRQWQIGEFAGEDAGSPMAARVSLVHNRLSRFTPDPAQAKGSRYSPVEIPLDVLVEREAAHRRSESDVRLAVELGLAFWRDLDLLDLRKQRQRYLDRFPLKPTARELAAIDPAARRFAEVMANRVPDGLALLAAMRKRKIGAPRAETVEALRDLAPRTREREAIARWLEWCGSLDGHAAARDPNTWSDERLEYSFAVSARLGNQEFALRADEYHGGGIDWHSFDFDPALELGAATDATSAPDVRTMLPAPASYRGMPLARWWEFEDADVHFGAVEAGPEDVGRMLLMEFALVTGNDWFTVPVELPVGSVCTIDSLKVTDTFGLVTEVPSVAETDGARGTWRMFSPTTLQPPRRRTPWPSLLLIPPGVGSALAGPPLEEVHLLRDEAANLAWGVERTVQGADGLPRSRFEDWQRRRREDAAAAEAAGKPPVPPTTAKLRYRLSTPPPEFWLPLVPVKDQAGRLWLELRTLLDDGNPPAPMPPRGRLLAAGQLVHEEEVPREGRAIARRYRHARWLGGRSFLWQHRRGGPSQGEGSSGLRYDVAEP